MESPIQDKKPQTFHRSSGPQSFSHQFEPAIGCSIEGLIATFVPISDVIASFLVGSIPLGIGSAASDIDIVVLLSSVEGLLLPSHASGDGIVFSAAVAGESARLVAGSVVAVRRSIEVDLEFVVASSVVELLGRLSRDDSPCSAREARILSRLKTGWVLTHSPAFEQLQARIATDAGLQRFCVREHTKEMLELLDEAAAAIASRPVALHLGRLAVESGFRAFFASNGLAVVGNKWLRFIKANQLERVGGPPFAKLVASGLPLLFPSMQGSEPDTREYLRQVERFTHEARWAIDSRLGRDVRPAP